MNEKEKQLVEKLINDANQAMGSERTAIIQDYQTLLSAISMRMGIDAVPTK